MSRNRKGHHRRLALCGTVAILIAVGCLVSLPGCNGGSSSGGSNLTLIGAIAEGLGLLPQNSVFLNNKIVAEFNLSIDPASVNSQTVWVFQGPDFNTQITGNLGVGENPRTIVFLPDLPVEPDYSDAGLQIDTSYKMTFRGKPDLNTIRSTNGHALDQTYQFEFRTRDEEPFFTDLVPGSPIVVGVLVDLNGDGVLDGDGDPDTPSDEEFFVGESIFDPQIPFATNVPVGSVNLPPPDAPVQVAFLFNEPLDPAAVLVDAEDLNDDGFPDGDGQLDNFFTLDETNPYPCDDPSPGDFCPRPVPFDFSLVQSYDTSRDAFTTLCTMEYVFALRGLARHLIEVEPGVIDLTGNALENDFVGLFETRASGARDDYFFEDFSDRSNRSDESNALWDALDSNYLQAGAGIGGDGGDGDPIDEEAGILVLDTTGNSGIFNFTNFVVPPAFEIQVKGDKPAIIRVLGALDIQAQATIDASGLDGAAGGVDSVAPRPGGEAGPGGGIGGSASENGANTVRGGTGVSPDDSGGGGEGGLTGASSGGGGGGGHALDGQAGEDGPGESLGDPPIDPAPGSGGMGGGVYDDPRLTTLRGGSGGGGGGNATTEFAPPGSPGSAGGSGGGGGGAIMFECLGTVQIVTTSTVDLSGGNGGGGGRIGNARHDSAGGGGGSGGAMLIRAIQFSSLGGDIQANGGNNGTANAPGGDGGDGGDGYLRFEYLEGGERPCSNCDPQPDWGEIDPDLLGFTIGRSRFFQTNAASGSIVQYLFDGNFADGSVRLDATDIVVLDENGDPTAELPENATIGIFFRGAFEDEMNPNQPDPLTITEWVADVTELNGLPLIQYEVRFDIGDDIAGNPPAPGVDDVRIRFSVE